MDMKISDRTAYIVKSQMSVMARTDEVLLIRLFYELTWF